MYAGQAGKILTTHTGSLPRPPELGQAFANRETGAGPVPPTDTMASMIADAVTEVTGRQAAIGIDIVSDGEVGKIGYSTYIKERLSGFGGEPGTLALADLDDHPAFTERALSGLVTQMPSCDGPVSYTGQQAIQIDLDNFAKALAGTGRRGLIPAASPGVISIFLQNRYYPSHDAYLEALAEAMAVEYRAITDAGFDLQLDCPDLAMGRHVQSPPAERDEFIRQISRHVEVLNDAIEGIDPDRIRLHICWGNYEGPHHHDVELGEILPIVARANVGALCFENANPRHAHEWRVFQDIAIPKLADAHPRRDRHLQQLHRASRPSRRAHHPARRDRRAGPCGGRHRLRPFDLRHLPARSSIHRLGKAPQPD